MHALVETDSISRSLHSRITKGSGANAHPSEQYKSIRLQSTQTRMSSAHIHICALGKICGFATTIHSDARTANKGAPNERELIRNSNTKHHPQRRRRHTTTGPSSRPPQRFSFIREQAKNAHDMLIVLYVRKRERAYAHKVYNASARLGLCVWLCAGRHWVRRAAINGGGSLD